MPDRVIAVASASSYDVSPVSTSTSSARASSTVVASDATTEVLVPEVLVDVPSLATDAPQPARSTAARVPATAWRSRVGPKGDGRMGCGLS